MTTGPTRPLLRLSETFVDLYPAEAAERLAEAPAAEIAAFLAGQPTHRAAALLERLSPQVAAECLEALGEDDVERLLAATDLRRVAALLARLDDETRQRRLSRLEPSLRSELSALMIYPPGTAGHLMDPRVVSFPAGMTAEGVLSRLHVLRRQRVQTVFVADAEGHLVGALPLHEVILAEPQRPLSELVTAAAAAVAATASREEVVDTLEHYPLSSLPVVDYDGRLVGAIRRDAMLQAVQEEATAGLQTMVGASREERALSKPGFAVRKRLPWLHVNLLTAFLAAAVVGIFEPTIAQFTALAVLLPVVAGQSGNTGAQALAVTMRGLALREVRVRHWLRVMVKESSVGLVNGVVIAVVTALGVYVWSWSPGLCLVIGVAMVFSMTVAGIAGTAIPMVLTAIGQDPAQSSSIILTTVTDVVGFMSFLGLAAALAGML